VSRQIEPADDALVVRWSGLSAAAVLRRELRIPYSAIRSVSVGLDELPKALAWRVGTSTGPLGETRRGRFWVGGKRLLLDVNDRRRALVLDLEGAEFDRVALSVDDPESLADAIRSRLGS
jgi:hypothetical protein